MLKSVLYVFERDWLRAEAPVHQVFNFLATTPEAKTETGDSLRSGKVFEPKGSIDHGQKALKPP